MTHCEADSTQTSRTRLIEAAIFCFSEKGYDGTGIREIALRAQANSSLVQYHFGGKEGLYNAALKFIFDHKKPQPNHLPPASAEVPGARAQAILALRDILQHLVHELMTCNGDADLEQAAMLLVTRELQTPRPETTALVLEHIRPYTEHLNACLRVLRPDLDSNGLIDMGASIYGPIFHMHSKIPLTRILRNDPEFPKGPNDIQKLVDHFTEFSLRGLGIAEAFPNQGA